MDIEEAIGNVIDGASEQMKSLEMAGLDDEAEELGQSIDVVWNEYYEN